MKNSKIKYASESQRGDENEVFIDSIKAREILDSRGIPTVEVALETDLGIFKASVPSGTSKGKYEAAELRDGGRRYRGMGVLKAVKNIKEIIEPKLKGKNPTNQQEIDDLMIKLDGTKNKSRLGTNAILPVSIAVCRAGAKANKLTLEKWISKIAGTKLGLPTPAILLIEGGLHGKGGSEIQEFMVVPQNKTFRESLTQAKKIYQELKKIIKKNYKLNTGLEGGFVLPIKNPEKVLSLILTAARQKKIKIILDVAASHTKLLQSRSAGEDEGKLRRRQTSSPPTPEYYISLAKQYPIIGLEDPFPQDDWRNWKRLNSKTESLFIETKVKKRKKSSSPILLIGDDLTVTNPERIKEVHKKKACNAVIIKPNQIGTVSETIEAAKLAKSFGWKIIVSHRSGETMDDFIADLAVGVGAEFIKSGAPSKPERMAKYNRLLEIEEEIK